MQCDVCIIQPIIKLITKLIPKNITEPITKSKTVARLLLSCTRMTIKSSFVNTFWLGKSKLIFAKHMILDYF